MSSGRMMSLGRLSVRYVEIGGRQVSVIGVGAWQFGSTSWGWGADFGDADVRRILDRALELGVNLVDTAEIYGRGRSELLVGGALAGRLEQTFIATKVSPQHLLGRSVHRAAARSLQRLGATALDLFQVHWPNPLVPQAWTMGAMRALQAQGLVRHVGVSNYSLARWRRAEAALGGPVITNQVRYHLLNRGPERELLPYAQAAGRYIIAYSPLGQGLLSGKYTPERLPRGVRLANSLFTPANVRRARPLLDVLAQVGAEHGATAAQIALAWLVHHPNVIAIPGAKSVAQVEANAAAADIQLSEDQFGAITQAADASSPMGRWRSAPGLVRRLVAR